ncbi:BMC domain-containing protein [Enterococcus malodoratus]|uniref:BMC domain-containing protein n=1 Tax=Enterococcus malodoratus TaxID=71451 RepID=UPI0039AEBEF9
MDFRIIKSPSKGTLEIITKRIGMNQATKEIDFSQFDAIGLIQGKLIDMVCAADLVEKAAGIIAVDVRGSCPQNMILLAIFGDTASVETAIDDIKQKMKKRG